MSIVTDEVHTDEELMGFLRAVRRKGDDSQVVTDPPIELAKRYYHPDNRPVPYIGPPDAA